MRHGARNSVPGYALYSNYSTLFSRWHLPYVARPGRAQRNNPLHVQALIVRQRRFASLLAHRCDRVIVNSVGVRDELTGLARVSPNRIQILHNFLYRICKADGDWKTESMVGQAVTSMRAQIGDGGVVCGLSGGVDSSVVAAL